MAKKWQEVQCDLHPDKAGVLWDLTLYVPTVGFLLLIGLRFWFGEDDMQWAGYGLIFLGCFFLFVGSARIMRRLLILPTAPVTMDINRDRIRFKLKNGDTRSLARDIRYFADHAGKSFALTGLDNQGAKREYIFHRKQFDSEAYEQVNQALEIYK